MTGRLFAGTLLVLACFGLGRLGPAGESLWPFQCLFGASFLLYLAAVWSIRHRGPASGRPAPRWELWAILGLATAMRVAIFSMPASDDVYRYLWEGKVQGWGVSPYEIAPLDAPAHLGMDLSEDPYLSRLNHPHLTTIYPPLAELWFRLAAWIAYSESTWKLLLLPWEALLVGGLVRLLGRHAMRPERVLIYAWNPLVLVAFAGEGHLDVLMMACLVWALVWRVRAPLTAGLAFGAAVAFKLVGGALALVFLRDEKSEPRSEARPFARALRFSLGALVICLAATVPFAQTARGLWTILIHFGVEMRHNGSVHAGLAAVLPPDAAAAATAVGFLAVAAILYWRLRDSYDLALTLLGTFLLFSPAVHPWYLTWLVPLLTLRLRWPWLVWTGTVAAAYVAYGVRAQTGGFELPLPWRVWIYLPVYAGLLVFGSHWIRSRRLRRRGDPPPLTPRSR